jgi:hypothetical protein
MPKIDPEYTQQQQGAWWFPVWLALRRVGTYLFNELVFGRAVVGNDPKFADAVSVHSVCCSGETTHQQSGAAAAVWRRLVAGACALLQGQPWDGVDPGCCQGGML